MWGTAIDLQGRVLGRTAMGSERSIIGLKDSSRRKKGADASTRTSFALAAGSMGGGAFLVRRFLFGAGAGAGGAMPASASRFCWRVRVILELVFVSGALPGPAVRAGQAVSRSPRVEFEMS